jgi:Rrf2 family protein
MGVPEGLRMLSRTSEYALRALIHLVQNEANWPIPGAHIASETSIPRNYLSKILRELVRVGILESSPGRTGGFRLGRPAKQVSLFEILAPFEQFERRRCPFGNQLCSDVNPCGAHDQWKRVVETLQQFLLQTTVYDVALRMSRRRASGARRNRKKRPKS